MEALLANHRRFLRFLEGRVGDRALAEDILQDAFVRTLEKQPSVPDDALVPWFYTVLRNAVTDRFRRDAVGAKRLEGLARELDAGRTATSELEREICACVSRLASTLKPDYAEALERVDVAGVGVKDYAAEAGITPGNAAVRVHRARRALKSRVAESCGLCAEHGCVDCTCGHR